MFLVKCQIAIAIPESSLGNLLPSLRYIFIRSDPVQKNVEHGAVLLPEIKVFDFFDNRLHKLLRMGVAPTIGNTFHEGDEVLELCLLVD